MEKINNLINKIEKFWLKNITGISLFLIILILLLDILPYLFFQDINYLSTTNTLTFIWAIFAFWYWYKKYERDKSIETAKNFIKNSSNLQDLFKNWILVHTLFQKGYITDEIWDIINKENLITIWSRIDSGNTKSLIPHITKSFVFNDFWNFLLVELKKRVDYKKKFLNNIREIYWEHYQEEDRVNQEIILHDLNNLIESIKSIWEKFKNN